MHCVSLIRLSLMRLGDIVRIDGAITACVHCLQFIGEHVISACQTNFLYINVIYFTHSVPVPGYYGRARTVSLARHVYVSLSRLSMGLHVVRRPTWVCPSMGMSPRWYDNTTIYFK